MKCSTEMPGPAFLRARIAHMLSALLLWVYSFAIFYVYGWGTLTFLQILLHLEQPVSSISFPIAVMVGMAVSTTITSFLSLLMPLGMVAALLLLGGGVFIAIYTRPFQHLHLPSWNLMIWVLLVLTGVVIMENATHTPTNPDTALYHAQAIRWIESYRAVPGLTNLHNRLGYNSSWLVLNASFSFAFLGIRSFHLSNSIMLLTALIYFSSGFENLLRGQPNISDIAKAVIFVLPLYFYISEASSPSTDLPATLLIWFTAVLIIEKLEKYNTELDLYAIAIFIISIYTVVIKLSALPLAGVAVLLTLEAIKARRWVQATILFGIGFLILLPWFLRSIILSGYLIFPIPQINIFTFDWKYPLENLIATRDSILWFARFPNKNWKDYMDLSFVQWVPLWFNHLTRNQKILLLLAAVSPLALLPYRAISLLKSAPRAYPLVLMINYVGLIFWFITAPDVRFGYGFLIAPIILVASPYLYALYTIGRQRLRFVSALFLLILIAFQMDILVPCHCHAIHLFAAAPCSCRLPAFTGQPLSYS